MKIKLIGNDSKNGIKVLKELKKVERKLDCKLNVEKISSKDKNDYNIKEIPTLIINDKTILSGNVMSERELFKILKPIVEIS